MEPVSWKARVLAIAAAVCLATPLHAQSQPQDEGAAFGPLIEGVRGLFNKIFGGSEKKPEAGPDATPPGSVAPATSQAVEARPAIAPTPVEPLSPAARSLHEAVVGGDYEATLRLLDQGADIEAKDPRSGASPLHYAVMKGRMPLIDLLLSRGADVNSRTRNGTTPLHTAALYARMEVAERLIEQRADINAVSLGGATPLALATAAKNKPMAEMLRERGAR